MDENKKQNNQSETKGSKSSKTFFGGKVPIAGELANNPKKNYLIVTFLLSLLAAFVMWIVAVDYEVEDFEKTFNNITVQLSGQSELLESKGMQVILDGDVKLSLTVSGKRSFLSSLDSSSFLAKVDVSGIEKEGKSNPLKVEIEPINGITVTSQSMTHITVTAEKRITDTFTIIPLLGTAQLENGVEYTLLCGTETVSVTGSESLIRKIKRAVVYVDPNPKNITESFNSHCEILFESDVETDFSSLIVSPQYCSVDVVLKKEKSVPAKIYLDGAPSLEYNMSFHTDVSSFVISGEPKVVDGIEYINVKIPYEKITNQLGSGKDSFTVKGTAEFPDGISNVNGNSEVEVTVEISNTAKTISGGSVHIVNCPLGYTAKVEDVEIKLTGLYEEIETITGTDIEITLDLSGVTPSVAAQSLKGSVNIENPYSVLYSANCFLTVSFLKSAG